MNKAHVFFYTILRPLVILFTKIKFGYTYEKAKDLPENYIVLSNHTTDFDMLFVGASFPRQMYFVGSEHISRWKLAYFFLKRLFAPILRYKGTVASSTVLEILRKVRKGANVCIFAEGIRTWDGVTVPILPSTGKMIKSAKCALVTYKIVGGYFASPAWSDKGTRRGYLHGAPVNVYTKEQLAGMSAEEINDIIVRDLYEDAYARQLEKPVRYRGKRLAEHMEYLLFNCPDCGGLNTFVSNDDTVSCKSCGLSFKYDEYGMLSGLPYKTVRELSDWQNRRVEELVEEGVVLTIPSVKLSTIEKQVETPVAEGTLTMTPTAIKCGGIELPLDSVVAMDMHGRHELVFNIGKDYYELVTPREIGARQLLIYYRAYKAVKARQAAEV